MSRKPARWMCTLDERILEHLNDDSWSTPRHMARVMKFDASRHRVSERCWMLAQAGFIAPLFEESKMYEITGEGQQYLEGKLDAENRPRPSPQALRS
ncbi:hypothetical protein OB905_11695 [Halobacteria archaeon AArc-dxtr1]|nr:hypothetical protein [Halobacteria archaeon AArc-dxtr1]